jgi:predicted phage-related endonuclease
MKIFEKPEIFTDLEQGSEAWFLTRCGCVTASEFKSVMSKGRGTAPSKTRRTYMLKLAGEIITGTFQETYKSADMERGNAMEPEARDLYAMTKGIEVEEVGFIKIADQIGYSPDGLVGDDGLLEIKTRKPELQIALLFDGEIPSEHIKQLQGGLYVSGRQWIDFVSYWPGLPIFIKRVYRDETLIGEISMAVMTFIAELDQVVLDIKSM